MYKKTAFRIIGFVLSLALTLSIYSIVVRPDFFHLHPEAAVKAIFTLATIMALVQCLFFLDILSEEDAPWNIGFFVSTLSIIGIIIFFSIWIMSSLDYNMMPNA
jgi:heme/copper-type cytochrome/quinol oxidase subunit 4